MKARILDYILFRRFGAFICWAFKGFKGNLNSELKDDKLDRNIIIGMLAFGLIMFLLGMIKFYYLEPN